MKLFAGRNAPLERILWRSMRSPSFTGAHGAKQQFSARALPRANRCPSMPCSIHPRSATSPWSDPSFPPTMRPAPALPGRVVPLLASLSPSDPSTRASHPGIPCILPRDRGWIVPGNGCRIRVRRALVKRVETAPWPGWEPNLPARTIPFPLSRCENGPWQVRLLGTRRAVGVRQARGHRPATEGGIR